MSGASFQMSSAMQQLYNGNVVVQVLTYNLDADELNQYIPDHYWRSLKQAPAEVFVIKCECYYSYSKT